MQNLTEIFTYHAPFGNQLARYVAIRTKARELAELVQDSTPGCREQSLAITAVQEAVMWANAAIAIHEMAPGAPTFVTSDEELERAVFGGDSQQASAVPVAATQESN